MSEEEYLRAARGEKFQAIALMDTYGENDPRPKIVRTLMTLEANEGEIQLSPGNQFVNLLHIEDVCTGLYTACENLLSGVQSSEPQYLISPHFITLRELVEQIELVRGIKLPVRWGAKPYRPGEMLEIPSINNLIPNWNSIIGLTDGLKKFF
jgi:nucleoside-diphosphate-sugar epimerase